MTKRDGSTGCTALERDGPYFEIMGQWRGPTINLKARVPLKYGMFYLSDMKVHKIFSSDP